MKISCDEWKLCHVYLNLDLYSTYSLIVVLICCNALNADTLKQTRLLWKQPKFTRRYSISGLSQKRYTAEGYESEFAGGLNHQKRGGGGGRARSSQPETVLKLWGQHAINSNRFFIQESSALSFTLLLPTSLSHPIYFPIPSDCVEHVNGNEADITLV